MSKAKSILKKIGWILSSFYVLSYILFILFQDYIFFQSIPLNKDYKYHFDQTFEEINIPVGDHVLLNALHFKSNHPKGLILYFHGNRGNLSRWGKYAEDFIGLGYDVLMYDFRGYGKSNGACTEQSMYQDAVRVLNWVQINLKYDTTIYYGRSIGTATAIVLASKYPPTKLILETPFDEIKGAMFPWLQPLSRTFRYHYSFNNMAALKNVTCPVVIFHGTDDWVVPLSSALRLEQDLKPGDSLYIIQGGDHHNLNTFDQYKSVIKEIFK